MYSRQKDLDELRAELVRIEQIEADDQLNLDSISKLDNKKNIHNIKVMIAQHEENSNTERLKKEEEELNAKGHELMLSHYKQIKEFNACLSKALQIGLSLKGLGNYRPNDFTKFYNASLKNALAQMIDSSEKGLKQIEYHMK